MILSGLRVFDIRDPHNPREIAYYNAPVDRDRPAGGSSAASNWAMSSPSFVPERKRDLVLGRLQRLLRRAGHQRAWPQGGSATPAQATGDEEGELQEEAEEEAGQGRRLRAQAAQVQEA